MSGQLLKNTEDKSKQVIIALRGQLDEANDEKVFLFVCLFVCLFVFQYNFIERTHVQLTFTKDNVQQNENYNLKLTKKKSNTRKTLVVTKIKLERN